MPDKYPILELLIRSPVLTEQLGSKPKFWVHLKGDEQPWLFKFAREKTGEHWAEKIAAEIAHKLGIPAATVELAKFSDKRGTVSRSFVRRNDGFDLIHGDELLGGYVVGYEREKVFHQSNHSLPNIVAAIQAVFTDAEARKKQLTSLAGLLVLDAIIGNTDRHHQNWAILKRTHPDGTVEQEMAPSYDHASSLGRNVSPKEIERRLKENSVLAYMKKGRGGIFWEGKDAKGANPLALLCRAHERWPAFFVPWLNTVHLLDPKAIQAILDKVPEDWMDTLQKKFCFDFLCSTCSELKKLPHQ